MKKNRYVTLTVVIALAFLLTQILATGQAPPAGQAPGGGGGRGGAGAPGAGGGGAGAGGAQRGGGGGGAQRGGGAPAADTGTMARTADGKPDFTGYYMATTCTNFETNCGRNIVEPAGGKIPYNPEWIKIAADTKATRMFDEPYAHCLPAGVPTNFGIQMGFQVVQDKLAIVFSWDTVGATRFIYLDDRKHVPANMRLYQGDSTARWEGDTLVVDTTSQQKGWFDASGNPHSDMVHVVERFTPNGASISYEAVVEDPKAFTAPMKFTDNFRRNTTVPRGFSARPTGYEQTETACVEGERDMALYTEISGGNAKEGTPGGNAPEGAVTTGGGRGGAGGAGGAGRGGAPGAGAGGAAPGGAPRGGGAGAPPAGQ